MKRQNHNLKSPHYIVVNMAFLILLISICSSCKKLVKIDTPVTRVSTDNVWKDNSTASSVLLGLYAKLSANFYDAGLQTISIYSDLSADNLDLFDINASKNYSRYYQNNLDPRYSDQFNSTFWRTSYDLLYTVNDAIEKLTGNNDLSPEVSKRLLGEAYFLRAFCNFYLVNLYGEVPLILTTRPNINTTISRSPVSVVYSQMIKDLKESENLLTLRYVPADVSKSTSERLRPNLAAVNALQARVFLYQKDFPAAEESATKVISQASLYTFTKLNQTFIANSTETIWALQPVNVGFNTYEGRVFLLPNRGPDGSDFPFILSKSLVDSFEPGDNRKIEWIDSVKPLSKAYYYPRKYRTPGEAGLTTLHEYTVVLRLGEQYLIRAEARNEQNKTADAIQDINALRTRSRAEPTIDIPLPLPNLSNRLSQIELRSVILHERRVELFTEWGHRWFDLKRSTTLDAIMNEAEIVKGGTWKNFKSLYPIPTSDIQLNPNLTQNPEYTN